MFWRTLLVVTLMLPARGVAATDAVAAIDPAVKTLISASVAARLGTSARVDVEVVQPLRLTGEPISADVVPGARFGTPSRFLVTFADGRRAAVVVKVTAIASHPVAARNLQRDTPVTAGDVEWVDGPLSGQPVASLPTAADVLGSRTRRALTRGEALTSAVLKPATAVNAGDPVTILIRRGPIEVRGEGRAINSGAIGDAVRVLRPGSRQPLQGRLVEPAVVEISR
jgi:flagella basal body P-ring formation protein FlgA